MSNETPLTPVPSLALSDPAQVRAYVHPTRMAILTMLAEPHTVTGLARRLGVHPANITHHVKLLEKTGLIRLVEKRDTGKNLEKYYQAVALRFTVAVGEAPPEDQGELVLGILRDHLSEAMLALRRVANPEEAQVLGLLKVARVRPADLETFAARLQALADEFGGLDDAEQGLAYTLNLSLYPGETPAQGGGQVRIGAE